MNSYHPKGLGTKETQDPTHQEGHATCRKALHGATAGDMRRIAGRELHDDWMREVVEVRSKEEEMTAEQPQGNGQ